MTKGRSSPTRYRLIGSVALASVIGPVVAIVGQFTVADMHFHALMMCCVLAKFPEMGHR